MVRGRGILEFWRETDGISLTEAMITLPIVMLCFAAFVEFGYAVFQWNQAVKALQYGARMAVVSDSVNDNYDPVAAGQTTDPTLVGDSISLTDGTITQSWSCGGSGTACNGNLNRIVYGSATATSCQPISSTSRPAMCNLDPWLKLENVVVTYFRSGLGYWGRPEGAVVSLRMETTGLTFKLPILGALLGLNSITVPAMPVTITSEDMKTCSTC